MHVQSVPVNQARHVEERPSGGVGPNLRVERSQPVGDTSMYHSSEKPRGYIRLDLRPESKEGGQEGPVFRSAPDTRRHPGVELGGIVQRGPAIGPWGLSGRSVRVDPHRELDDGPNRLIPSSPTRPIPAWHSTRDAWPEDPRIGGDWAGNRPRQRLPRTPVKIQDVHQRPSGLRSVHYRDEDHRVRDTVPMSRRMGLGALAQNPQSHFDVSRYPSLSPHRRPAWRTILDDDEDSDFGPARSPRRNTGYQDRSARKPKPSTRDKKDMKLEKFDGKTRIESFLAKFEICARHNGWSEADRIDNLQCSLVGGDAAQILWDMGAEGVKTSKDLIRQLETRYGSANQTALYRTQLKYRRRQKGETLGDLVNDVRRLIILAYPGPSSTMRETFACEAFLEALNDKDLALKIREKEPSTLEQACQMAMRLEAYEGGALERDRRVPQTRQVTESSDGSGTSYDRCTEFLRDWSQLQQANFEKLMSEVESFFAKQDKAIIPPTNCSGVGPPSLEGPPTGRNWIRRRRNGNYRGDSRRPQGCYNCGEDGHFMARCPYPPVERDDPNRPGRKQELPVSVTNHIKGEAGAYLKISIGGRRYHALLDTGSEILLIPKDLVPLATLSKTVQVIHAANGTEIKVLGETELAVKVADLEISFDCLVVRDVSDVILGLDWMTKYVDTLNLKEKTIVVQGRTLLLSKNPRKGPGRLVVCARRLIVPPRSEANVACRVKRSSKAPTQVVHVDKLKRFDGEPPRNWLETEIGTPEVEGVTDLDGDMSEEVLENGGVGDGPTVSCSPVPTRPSRIRREPDRLRYYRRIQPGILRRQTSSRNPVPTSRSDHRLDRKSRCKVPTRASGQLEPGNKHLL